MSEYEAKARIGVHDAARRQQTKQMLTPDPTSGTWCAGGSWPFSTATMHLVMVRPIVSCGDNRFRCDIHAGHWGLNISRFTIQEEP